MKNTPLTFLLNIIVHISPNVIFFKSNFCLFYGLNINLKNVGCEPGTLVSEAAALPTVPMRLPWLTSLVFL